MENTSSILDKSISVVISCVPIAIAIVVGYYSSLLNSQSASAGSSQSRVLPRFNTTTDETEKGLTAKKMSTFYDELKKPSYAPPPIAFSIIWPILYFLLAVATFLATFWAGSCEALTLYVVLLINLVFNVAFPYAQFLKGDLAVSMIMVWGALVTATLFVFMIGLRESGGCVTMFSTLCVTPYVLWLCFASALSADIYNLNREKDGKEN